MGGNEMKRYYYQGKEISERKANLIIYGTMIGIPVFGIGLYAMMNILLTAGAIMGW